jgi:hypothetical protein
MVTFTIGLDDLAPYDPAMRLAVEPGNLRVFVGGSSTGGLEGRCRFVGDTVVLSAAPAGAR